jgi:hypothetical protein
MSLLIGLIINVAAAFLIVNKFPGLRVRDRNTAIAVSLAVGLFLGMSQIFLAPMMMLTLAMYGYMAESRDLVTAIMYTLVGFGTAGVTLMLAEELTSGFKSRNGKTIAGAALALALIQGILASF